MEHTIEHDSALDACIITVRGVHTRPKDSLELLRIAGSYATEHKCSRFLFDMREASIAGGALGAYETPLDPETLGVKKWFKIAAVYATVSEDERLLEDVGVNRGAIAFRVFGDISAARHWLAERASGRTTE